MSGSSSVTSRTRSKTTVKAHVQDNDLKPLQVLKTTMVDDGASVEPPTKKQKRTLVVSSNGGKKQTKNPVALDNTKADLPVAMPTKITTVQGGSQGNMAKRGGTQVIDSEYGQGVISTPSVPQMKKPAPKAKVEDEEKRLRRFRQRPPQSYTERLERATTQRCVADFP